ncbi:hypothetical protein LTR37_015935 [Vermiconidia calcicola]|uniref:Uncharacterized protein n=1 Tax=Vermiconidia calcicola TaxID=1690605 RepID=A0ACC3MQX4_9PEZI|nr:hypothetical protein LTR37_015935 [Vermiconidia calcicola]
MSTASMTSEMALSYFYSNNDGLAEEDVAARCKATGPNILSTTKPPAWWQQGRMRDYGRLRKLFRRVAQRDGIGSDNVFHPLDTAAIFARGTEHSAN